MKKRHGNHEYLPQCRIHSTGINRRSILRSNRLSAALSNGGWRLLPGDDERTSSWLTAPFSRLLISPMMEVCRIREVKRAIYKVGLTAGLILAGNKPYPVGLVGRAHQDRPARAGVFITLQGRYDQPSICRKRGVIGRADSHDRKVLKKVLSTVAG